MSRPRLIWVSVLLGALCVSGCENNTQPPPPADIDPLAFTSETALIEGLVTAYQTQDREPIELLFANKDEDNVEYAFILSAPMADNVPLWGFVTELRIHSRMFISTSPFSPPEPEVPEELWLDQITIELTLSSAFFERQDLYKSDSNPGGLDPQKWRATSALYSTFVLFDTAGDVNYIVEGAAKFIVIEDLAKEIGTRRKFLLYRWEDINPLQSALAITETTWSEMKARYLP